MKTAILIIFAFVPLLYPAYGQAVEAELSVRVEQEVLPARAGGTAFAVVDIQIPPGKHIYGNPKGPGTGKPTTVTLDQSPGISLAGARFLPPEKYTAEGEKNFVWIYTGHTRVLVPLEIEGNVIPGDRPVRLMLNTLLCDEKSCMPRTAELALTVRVLPAGSLIPEYPKAEIAKFSVIPGNPAASAHTRSADKVSAGIKFTARYISSGSISGLLQAILFALLAGFLLNFMPCVLPVVSLKVMSLVRHSGEERKVLVRLGLLFSLGILTIFFLLALLALVLGYNWGELFQKRWFLISMIALVFALALSMFGLFSLNIPRFASRLSQERANPYLDSYIKGLLATLLATPCSGPFLGGTLAWSFTQPPAILFAIFISVGAGMAMPYLVLTAFPRLTRFIPRPGNWTVDFERIMAFLLIATDIYLINILTNDMVVPTLSFLGFVSLGLWIYGRFGAITETTVRRIAAFIGLVLIVLGGCLFSFNVVHRGDDAGVTIQSRAFSLEELQKNRDRGRISVVKFTADWCPNCTLVEKTSLYTRKVIDALEARGADLMVADITREHKEAQGLLSELGSRSIPFLAVFPAGEEFDKPYCLRDIYSEDDVLAALDAAARTGK
ncbi:MAG: hypothetical protein EPN93_05830 [Spirochaetes bacterium]|nr:MAG: hypothetical protein EPN93_05830 [Spirochaetota bacterium]